MAEIRPQDHIAITQLIYRVARALDRRDKALLKSCFWPDATDDHGVFTGSAMDFADWVMSREPEPYEFTHHNVTNVLIDIAGDRAIGEAYFIAFHRMAATGNDMIAAGRYLDRFESRDNEWRIVHRHAVYDWTTNASASDAAWRQSPVADLIVRGERGMRDPSYRELDWLRGR